MMNDLFGTNDTPETQESSRQSATPSPLAERMRPCSLDDIVGQDELLAPGRPLRLLIERDTLPSILLWGPPGCGKTTLARIIAQETSAHFLEYSAVQVGSKVLKEAMAEASRLRRTMQRRTIIFLDEIHRFNKAQQDALLPWVEKGDVTLIGATTENPSFEINPSLLSRTRLFVLKNLESDHIMTILRQALASELGLADQAPPFDDDALKALADLADGDARTALNLIELTVAAIDQQDQERVITAEILEDMIRDRALRYDRAGEEHYNIISALHKSIRNSDPDAALYWLARMLEGGEDPLYVARRLVRIASEDIGLADPQALVRSVAARDAVQFLGPPEGHLALAQACVDLSLSPKSNAIYKAYGEVCREVQRGVLPGVPLQLRNAPTTLLKELGYGAEYQYAHDSADGITPMNCLPDSLLGRRFYEPTNRGFEARYGERLQNIRQWREQHGDKPVPRKDKPE